MTNSQVIRATVKEIIDLSTKSAILADKKSKLFCDQYTHLNNSDEFLKILCTDHGLKTDRLSSYVFLKFFFAFSFLLSFHLFNYIDL